tara:strand:- start:216 stop:506 length:291 start_codon:yes stop_codon:yes gene_type:complete
MPLVARIGDADTNHAPCPPASCSTGSPNVFANNIPVHRVGDTNTPHGFILCIPHVTSLSTGSPNVIVNNMQCGRLGDSYSCGITVNAGSPNVIANG